MQGIPIVRGFERMAQCVLSLVSVALQRYYEIFDSSVFLERKSGLPWIEGLELAHP